MSVPTKAVFESIVDPLFANITEQHHRLELSNLLLDFYVIPLGGDEATSLRGVLESVLSIEQYRYMEEQLGDSRAVCSPAMLVAHQLYRHVILVAAGDFVKVQLSGGKAEHANWAYQVFAQCRAAGTYLRQSTYHPQTHLPSWFTGACQQHWSLLQQQRQLDQGHCNPYGGYTPLSAVHDFGQLAGYGGGAATSIYHQLTESAYTQLSRLSTMASTVVGGIVAHGDVATDSLTKRGGLRVLDKATQYNTDLAALHSHATNYVRSPEWRRETLTNFAIHPNMRVQVNDTDIELFYYPDGDTKTNSQYYDQVRHAPHTNISNAVAGLLSAYEAMVAASEPCTELDGELVEVNAASDWNLALCFVRYVMLRNFEYGTKINCGEGQQLIIDITPVLGDEPTVKLYLKNA